MGRKEDSWSPWFLIISKKEYDIELFYNNPTWASSFVRWHLEKYEKEEEEEELYYPQEIFTNV